MDHRPGPWCGWRSISIKGPIEHERCVGSSSLRIASKRTVGLSRSGRATRIGSIPGLGDAANGGSVVGLEIECSFTSLDDRSRTLQRQQFPYAVHSRGLRPILSMAVRL